MNVSVSHKGCYLAEWYRIGLTASIVDEAIAELGAGTGVRLLILMAAPRDDVLYGVFVAESTAEIEDACRAAGYPIERITGDVGVRILAAGFIDGGPRFPTGLTDAI